MELRGIQSEQIQRSAKRKINLEVLKAQDEDQGQQFVQSSPV